MISKLWVAFATSSGLLYIGMFFYWLDKMPWLSIATLATHWLWFLPLVSAIMEDKKPEQTMKQ